MSGEAVEKKLYNAASKGDVTTLVHLLEEDPYLVHGVLFPYSRNLLHIAAIHGQKSIIEEVLNLNPELACISDSQKSSPLHIAAARGHVEIASILLSKAPEMCWQRDDQGMNPVHVAAMNGHVEILELLLVESSMPAMERLHHGQTVLHLCVKHAQLRALKVLVEKMGDLVCTKDYDGDTLLHCAVRCNQLEMSKSIMVVVILIATMAFQSATSPAGGVWSEDDARHSYKAGKAVMASTHPYMYKKMTLANTMAFICSLTAMYLFTTRIHVNNLFFMMASWTAMLAALLSITITYIASVYMITPDEIMHSTGNKILLVVMLVLYGFGLISMFVSFVIQLHQSWDNKRRRQLDLSADAFPWRVFYWIFQQMEETRGHFQMFQR
ncbi:ankyrin repeat-containing protein At5g02620-like [Salvia hispanica]|uniref:ankyrin repeat-containing protein At5g02620-like n=1 Tax=Salvia hispanica TaxID=49212 RepID=UPI0020098FFA|nr:ankyrin repeat-containing protein At5g02620-like [Salvia hispanica]